MPSTELIPLSGSLRKFPTRSKVHLPVIERRREDEKWRVWRTRTWMTYIDQQAVLYKDTFIPGSTSPLPSIDMYIGVNFPKEFFSKNLENVSHSKGECPPFFPTVMHVYWFRKDPGFVHSADSHRCSRLPYTFTSSVDSTDSSQKDQESHEVGQIIVAATGYGSVSWPGEHLCFDHQIK